MVERVELEANEQRPPRRREKRMNRPSFQLELTPRPARELDLVAVLYTRDQLRASVGLTLDTAMELGYGVPTDQPLQRDWSPYSMNGGTVLALAGEDYALIASDTRLSEGFQIYSRVYPKTYSLPGNMVLGCCGFHGDVLTVIKNIKIRMQLYKHKHRKQMSCPAAAQNLSVMLYMRRFFPYYTYNILAGLDSEGKGCVFSFDPVGSYDRETYRAGGSAAAMLQPLLDNQIGLKNQTGVEKEPPSLEKALALVQDVFSAAAERDIYTGDGVEINIITAGGVEVKHVPLRRD